MLLSDADYSFSSALKFPLLEVGNLELIKRMTFILKNGESYGQRDLDAKTATCHKKVFGKYDENLSSKVHERSHG